MVLYDEESETVDGIDIAHRRDGAPAIGFREPISEAHTGPTWRDARVTSCAVWTCKRGVIRRIAPLGFAARMLEGPCASESRIQRVEWLRAQSFFATPLAYHDAAAWRGGEGVDEGRKLAGIDRETLGREQSRIRRWRLVARAQTPVHATPNLRSERQLGLAISRHGVLEGGLGNHEMRMFSDPRDSTMVNHEGTRGGRVDEYTTLQAAPWSGCQRPDPECCTIRAGLSSQQRPLARSGT